MENSITREKIKALLSSDGVIDKVMHDLNWIVNDDMMTGATLIAKIKYPECALNDMQLQVRLVVRNNDFLEDYHDKAPKYIVDNKLNIKDIKNSPNPQSL